MENLTCKLSGDVDAADPQTTLGVAKPYSRLLNFYEGRNWNRHVLFSAVSSRSSMVHDTEVWSGRARLFNNSIMNIRFIHMLILAFLTRKVMHVQGNIMKQQGFPPLWASGHLLAGLHLFYFILSEIIVNIHLFS